MAISEVFVLTTRQYECAWTYLFHVDPEYVTTFITTLKSVGDWRLNFGVDTISVNSYGDELQEVIDKLNKCLDWDIKEQTEDGAVLIQSPRSRVALVPLHDPKRDVVVKGSYYIRYDIG